MTTALEIINESITSVRDSRQPDTVRPLIAGEINMAYKLKLIDYVERDELMTQLLLACQKRRAELHRARMQEIAR
jgi:hypothetical protein